MRYILISVLVITACSVMYGEQTAAEEILPTPSLSQGTQTIKTPEAPRSIAPESTPPPILSPTRTIDLSSDKPSGPQVNSIHSQPPKGPKSPGLRAKPVLPSTRRNSLKPPRRPIPPEPNSDPQ